MSGWGEDFLSGIKEKVTNTAQAAAGNVSQSATDFFSQSVSKGLVAVGSKPLGNLSQAEIDSGQTGATSDVAKAVKATSPALIFLGLGLALYLFSGKRK